MIQRETWQEEGSPYLPAAPVGEIRDQEPPALLSAAAATAARSAVRVAASAGPVVISPSLGRLCELDEESDVDERRRYHVRSVDPLD